MHRHERYMTSVIFFILLAILISNECDIFQKSRNIFWIHKPIIARRHRHKFGKIFHFPLIFGVIILSLEILIITRSFDDIIHQLGNRFFFGDFTKNFITRTKRTNPIGADARHRIQKPFIFRNFCNI